MSDNDTNHDHPARTIAEALDSRDWDLNAGELHKSFLDLVGAVIAVAREVANVAATADRANDRLDSINEGRRQLMEATHTNQAPRAAPSAAPDARLVDPSAANARHDGEEHDDTDARLSRLLADMEEQSTQETLRRELEHARQYQTRAKLAEHRVDFLYRNLVEMWRMVRCAEEDAQAPEQLRKALVSIETRLRAMLESAGKLPPE
ncbi:hypothetical protein LMG28727_02931 [Paraburkholderia kirstenboschensis]|uniref:hypothetical protein n=1 Tax=Paraburkholderia kirstenboschensis TaxID=1245436 RepID=UPI000A6E5F19|nr:hypothetical protein [Paraburkholderia kirstenboschensis]CAD6532399.1 hypothetical protein LMG28727_02931 [Paraburkholderia kirstenboschensis]